MIALHPRGDRLGSVDVLVYDEHVGAVHPGHIVFTRDGEPVAVRPTWFVTGAPGTGWESLAGAAAAVVIAHVEALGLPYDEDQVLLAVLDAAQQPHPAGAAA